MKKLLTVAVFLFLAVQINFAQLKDDEIKDLRKQIKISDKDIIRVNKRENLSSNDSLKIYLSIDRRGSEKKYFEKWIADWNTTNGDQYGKLELVNEMSKADIVLTQFVLNKIKQVRESGISVGNVPPDGKIKPRLSVKSGTDIVVLKLPVYSYLIKRENGIWTILYGSVETSVNGEQLINSEDALQRALSEKMKNR